MQIVRTKRALIFCLVTFLTGCTSLPKGITPVDNFEVEKYLGTWYEIARLDHRFERGLSKVSAEYSLLENGDIRVLNSGFSEEKQEQNTAEGTARFVDDSNQGHLKVSFFGPFYASYVVFELDENYEYAFVSGLQPEVPLATFQITQPRMKKIIDQFKVRAQSLGFNTDELIFVDH